MNLIEPQYIKGVEITLTSEELAAIFKRPVRTIYNWAYTGKIPCIRDAGRHFRFLPSQINRWMEQQQNLITQPNHLKQLTEANQ